MASPATTRRAKRSEARRPPGGAEIVPARSGRRRRRWPVVLLVSLVLAALAGGAVLLTRTPVHAVPAVVDRAENEAVSALRRFRFAVRIEPVFSDDVAKGTVLGQKPSPGTRQAEGMAVVLTVSQGPTPTPVPDLAGLTLAQATARLAEVGHQLGAVTPRNDEEVAAGKVLEWSGKGESPPKGAVINLVVSAGPEKRLVPDGLLGRIFDDVAEGLRTLGLVPVPTNTFTENESDKGSVVSLSPAAGQKVDRGAKVVVAVSQGQPVVPKVIGLNVDVATKSIQDAGLAVKRAFGLTGAKVVLQSSPSAGTKMKPGGQVELVLGF